MKTDKLKSGKRRFVSKDDKTNKQKNPVLLYAGVELKQSQVYRIHIPSFKYQQVQILEAIYLLTLQ